MTILRSEAADFHPEIPQELALRTQWVGWRYGHKRPNGKREKLPINPRTGRRANVNDPATWGTLGEALWSVAARNLDGIGYVFSKEDPYTGGDLDGCRNRETGDIAPWATRIITAFGSYAEVSPSGTGVKIIARGSKPEVRKRRGPVEMYDRERFFTITGDVLEGHEAIADSQGAIEKLQGWLNATEAPQAPREAVPVALEDGDLLRKARAAANGAKFRRLHDEGDAKGHASDSEAVMALMGMLAFWTGRDSERMVRLFAASALGTIPKWRDRPAVVRSTVKRAVAGCERVYDPDWKRPDPMGPKASDDGAVERILEGVETTTDRDPWKKRSGPTDKHMVGGFVELARKHGKAAEGGVEVYASWRVLAENTGVSDRTAKASIRRVVEAGRYVRLIEKGKGRTPARYLVLAQPPTCSKLAHKEAHVGGGSKLAHKDVPPNLCSFYGLPSSKSLRGLLGRWRNPGPVVEADYDRNGRKIAHDTRHLKIPRGKGHALVIEKVVAFPGITLQGLADSLEREARNVARMVRGLIEDGFVFDHDGRYFAPHDLEERLLNERRDTGSEDRERAQRDRHEEDRRRHEEKLRELEERAGQNRTERLRDAALACGVPEEELKSECDDPREAHAPEDALQEEGPVIGSVAEVLELAHASLGVIPP